MSKDRKLEKSRATTIVIDEERINQRLDNFLFNRLKNVPKSHIYKMLRSGEFRVNKKRVKPSYKLQAQDELRIPPFWEKTISENKPGNRLIQLLLGAIIFEDSRILVINKPTGIASHGGSGINFGAIEILREARSDLKNLELVHRLDRDTSGCLMLAKKRSALRELHKLSQEGKILKKYVLLVRGKWQGGKMVVDVPLLKNQLRSNERIVTVNGAGKESITVFRPLKVSNQFSLLEAELKTGRTHQIRVHASHVGYPIVGDNKYGDAEFNRVAKERGLKRLFLHAVKIIFCWPAGEKAEFISEFDDEFKRTLVQIFSSSDI